MTYLASIRVAVGSSARSTDSEQPAIGDDVDSKTGASGRSIARTSSEEFDRLVITRAGSGKALPDDLWKLLFDEYSDVHSISLKDLEIGIEIDGGSSEQRTFFVEKMIDQRDDSSLPKYRLVETSNWFAQIWVALFGSSTEQQSRLRELRARIETTNGFHEGLAIQGTYIDRKGTLRNHDGFVVRETYGIVENAARHAIGDLPKPRLPLIFREGTAQYESFMEKRTEAIKNAVMKDFFPLHAQPQFEVEQDQMA